MELTNTRFKLPGYSVPLDWTPAPSTMFPMALTESLVERLNTHREVLMMRVLNSITDKPEWERKVRPIPFPSDEVCRSRYVRVLNEGIIAKWREEITNSEEGVSPAMLNWIIKEAQWKAEIFQDTGHVEVFDPGVMKSDTAITEDARQMLRDSVRPLMDIPEELRDYHPGSDEKVIDLVHPSLFPVVYGRTRILHEQLIGLDNLENSIGQGTVLVATSGDDTSIRRSRQRYTAHESYSRRFQWLPCDVHFTGGGECRIMTYINNLHPRRHQSLYRAIEKILTKTVPLWNMTLTLVQNRYTRIPYEHVEYDESSEPEPKFDEKSESRFDFYERIDRWRRQRPIRSPEPGEFTPRLINVKDQVNLCERFTENGLQVIVKLANIELTPEKPRYDGGSWHIEGQLNEHICATAIYYYDSENITESRLQFRQRADIGSVSDIGYEQSQHEFLQAIFNLDPDTAYNDGNVTQMLGSVDTRQGRLVTFPNSLQHRVSPFSLADKTKPGHRKILALFLVDPHISIISSGNVPPQQEDWWEDKLDAIHQALSRTLPAELQSMVNSGIEATPMTMEEAKQYRKELMEERSNRSEKQNREFEIGTFSLCEH